MLKKFKFGCLCLIGGGFLLSLAPVFILTSCNHVSNYSIDGKNWQGYISGELNKYKIDEVHKTVTYGVDLSIRPEAGNVDYVANDLVIPEFVEYHGSNYKVLLGQLAFAEPFPGINTNLTGTLTFTNGVDFTEDADGCFLRCPYITSVLFSNTMTIVPDSTFDSCTHLSKIDFNHAKITNVEDSAFCATALEYVITPETLITIEQNAFESCKSLKFIRLNDGLKLIGDRTFLHDKSMEDLWIPSSVESIGGMAFWDTSLLNVYLIDQDVTKSAMEYGIDDIFPVEAPDTGEWRRLYLNDPPTSSNYVMPRIDANHFDFTFDHSVWQMLSLDSI